MQNRCFSRLVSCGAIALVVLSIARGGLGQSSVQQAKNNPYSPSPTTPRSPDQDPTIDETLVSLVKPSAEPEKAKTPAPRVGPTSTISPTNTYLVGIGDVLKIELKNSPNGTGYYRVNEDGRIDFPLAQANISALGKSADEIAAELKRSIRLFADPDVVVSVCEFRSHWITVRGLAIGIGERELRREATPLFVIRTEAEVRREATHVVIRRAGNGPVETLDLRSPNADATLVFSGDTVEFRKEG